MTRAQRNSLVRGLRYSLDACRREHAEGGVGSARAAQLARLIKNISRELRELQSTTN